MQHFNGGIMENSAERIAKFIDRLREIDIADCSQIEQGLPLMASVYKLFKPNHYDFCPKTCSECFFDKRIGGIRLKEKYTYAEDCGADEWFNEVTCVPMHLYNAIQRFIRFLEVKQIEAEKWIQTQEE